MLEDEAQPISNLSIVIFVLFKPTPPNRRTQMKAEQQTPSPGARAPAAPDEVGGQRADALRLLGHRLCRPERS